MGCREEKIKRALRHQKHASAASETASDRSRTDRDSAELKPGAYTFPLAVAPERGILKKGFSQGSLSGVKSLQPLLATTSSNVNGTPTTEDAENQQELLSPTAAAVVCDAANSNGLEFIDGVDDDDDDGGSCSCSCDEGDSDVAADGDGPADGLRTAENVDCAGAGGCSVETQTDPESLTSSMTSLFDPGEKMTRLCNINELLRQIDEQFNSVLRATSMTLPDTATELSPANSDDVRGSETEADRACLQFFPQGGTAADNVADSRSHISSNDAPQRDEAAALDRVTEPAVRPVIRPVPLVPHRLYPNSAVSETADLPSLRPAEYVPYHGATSGLASSLSSDRLLSCTAPPMPPGTSPSPATVTSEGYHSDRVPPVEPDLPVIIREIPKPSSTTPVHFPSDSNVRPQSKRLNSPDDVDV